MIKFFQWCLNASMFWKKMFWVPGKVLIKSRKYFSKRFETKRFKKKTYSTFIMFDILVFYMYIILWFFQCAVDECGARRSIIWAAGTGQCGVRDGQKTVDPHSSQWQVLHLLRRCGDRENTVSIKSSSLSYMYMYPEENDFKVLWDKMNIITLFMIYCVTIIGRRSSGWKIKRSTLWNWSWRSVTIHMSLR